MKFEIYRRRMSIKKNLSDNNYINTTDATSGARTAYPSGALDSPEAFSEVRVTRSLVLCVCFVDRCLSICLVSLGHCVFCPSIYGF